MTQTIPVSAFLDALGANDRGGSHFYNDIEDFLNARGFTFEFESSAQQRNVLKFMVGLAVTAFCEEEFGGANDRALAQNTSVSEDQAFRFRKAVRETTLVQVDNQSWRGEGFLISNVGNHSLVAIPVSDAGIAGESVTFQEDGDTAEFTAEFAVRKGERVLSIPQLLEKFNVDLSVWQPILPKLNKWEMGYVDNAGEPNHYELFQVKVSLERIMPTVRKFPVLKPISIDIRPVAPRSTSPSPFRRALIIPDPQIGFRRDLRTFALEPLHDRAAMDVVLQIAETILPDDVIVVGDWLDLASWSTRFLRSPEFAQTTNPALAEAVWWLGQFRQHAQASAHFIPGNHEKRVADSIMTHLEEAYDLTAGGKFDDVPLLSIQNLLQLDDLGYECAKDYPHGEVWLNDAVRVSHGSVVRGGSGKTAEAILKSATNTEVFGHIHRVEMFSKTHYDRRGSYPITAFSPGCLCRTDEAVPGATARKNWQPGLGIIDYDADGTAHSITPIPIEGGRAIYNGELFEARNHEAQLSRDTGWPLECPESVYRAPYAK